MNGKKFNSSAGCNNLKSFSKIEQLTLVLNLVSRIPKGSYTLISMIQSDLWKMCRNLEYSGHTDRQRDRHTYSIIIKTGILKGVITTESLHTKKIKVMVPRQRQHLMIFFESHIR